MNQQPTSTSAPRRNASLDLRPLAAQFDLLADDATVPVKVFAAVAAEGVSTIWGKAARGEAGFPKLIRRGTKCTRARVGDIRAYLAGKASE